VPVGLTGQLPRQRVHHCLVAFGVPIGNRPDHGTLVLEQRGDRLVDRAGGQQVPGVDCVLLADAMAAVLGLVVLGGRPVELKENDVGCLGKREALPGNGQ
jgi:hypothetical protein